jgi:hypothetical protein
LTVWGCNRQVAQLENPNKCDKLNRPNQVSQFGQTHWLSLTKDGAKPASTHRPQESRGVFIQLGAGGGGLTQAPSQLGVSNSTAA